MTTTYYWAKQHAVVNLQLNIVTCARYPEKCIRNNVIAPFFLLLSVFIEPQPTAGYGVPQSLIPSYPIESCSTVSHRLVSKIVRSHSPLGSHYRERRMHITHNEDQTRLYSNHTSKKARVASRSITKAGEIR